MAIGFTTMSTAQVGAFFVFEKLRRTRAACVSRRAAPLPCRCTFAGGGLPASLRRTMCGPAWVSTLVCLGFNPGYAWVSTLVVPGLNTGPAWVSRLALPRLAWLPALCRCGSRTRASALTTCTT